MSRLIGFTPTAQADVTFYIPTNNAHNSHGIRGYKQYDICMTTVPKKKIHASYHFSTLAMSTKTEPFSTLMST